MIEDLNNAPLWPTEVKVAERDVEGDACKWAKKEGWLSYKFTSPSRRAVPDRVFIKDGIVVWVEFKKKGKKPTTLQNKRGRDISEHGGLWFWTDDLDHFKNTLNEFYENAKQP